MKGGQILTLLLAALSLESVQAQETAWPTHKHSIRMHIGVGFDDGLLFSTTAPLLGFGYEYRLGRHWGVGADITSFYRATSVIFQFANPANGTTSANAIIAGLVTGPFVTEADRQYIADTGIRRIDPRGQKHLSMPLAMGLTFYPVSSRRHRLGLTPALNITYESQSIFSGSRGVELELNDGTIYRNVFVTLNADYRQLVLGFSPKLSYEFHARQWALGLRLGNHNFFWLGDAPLFRAELFWESSLCFIVKI